MPQQISRKILLYFFLFVILGTFNNKNLNFFELPKINSIKIYGLEKEDLIFEKSLDLIKINNVFFTNKSQIQKLFETNNLIEEYQIFKRYPSSLEVEIVKAKFLAQTNIDGKIFFVGSNGKLIEKKSNSKNLPYIFGNFDIDNFLNLKKIIDETNLDFKEIKNLYFFPSGRWDVEILSKVLIKLPSERLKESINLSLDFLNNKKFNNIEVIDLRQKNQVIIDER